MKEKSIKYADQTWLNTNPEMTQVGGLTTVATIAKIAAVKQMALNWQPGAFKEGDQVEWKVTLSGTITIDKSMLQAVVNELIR